MAALTVAEVQAIQAIIQPIPSKRMRLMRGLKELLSTITTDRGYSKGVTEVTFDVKGWQAKTGPQTPCIYIIDDRQTITRHAGCVREYVHSFRVFGVVMDCTIEQFEAFISDVEQCLYDNNTLFGQVNKLEVPEVSTDNQLFSEQEQKYCFEVVVDCEYTRNARTAT